jgi:CRP-like cAMP-binding protein
MPTDPARLRAFPLFDGLADDDLTMLAERFDTRNVVAGEHLARQGASGYFFFVIFDGSAEVSRDGASIARLGPGDVFGETAILETVRRTATVTATTPMVVGALFGADFAKLAADSPEVHARIAQVMNERRPSQSGR